MTSLSALLAFAASLPAAAPVSSPPPERVAALERPMREKWRHLALEQAQQEADPDYRGHFLLSVEARQCGCVRPNPSSLVVALETKQGGESGMALLAANDGLNTTCTVCFLDAYTAWRNRVDSTCDQMLAWPESELNRLELSDEGPSVPRRCFTESRATRSKSQPGLPASAVVRPPTPPPPPSMPAAPEAGPPDNQVSGSWVTINGYTYYRPPRSSGEPGETQPAAGRAQPNSPAGQSAVFVPPPKPPPTSIEASVPAPPPSPPIEREEGRLYVRLNMSSVCVAELLPGPIQARNGDLMVIPKGAQSLEVRSPCGGVAEIFFGKETSPRLSEVFAKDQPLSFMFKPQ